MITKKVFIRNKQHILRLSSKSKHKKVYKPSKHRKQNVNSYTHKIKGVKGVKGVEGVKDKPINNAKPTMCAPFIQTTDISQGNKLLHSNINIVKSATNESCFSIEALRKIAEKWNASYPSNSIVFNKLTDGKTLWNKINNVMNSKCKTEICWMKQDFINDSLLAKELLNNFKPMMPKSWNTNPIEWLNTIDIRDVLTQYEIRYPEFEFIGPVPMDFDTKLGVGQCVVDELCDIKLNSLLSKGDTKLGVVFNLDKHTQSGSHWVAMYCDVKGGQICYWDSYGMEPNPEVVILMERLKQQGKELGYSLEIKINNTRHQYKNSECGVYCIYFITSLLDGKQFDDVVNNIINDDDMNDNRSVFFNKTD